MPRVDYSNLPATFFQQKPSFFQFQGFVRIALNLTKLCTARNLYIYTVYIYIEEVGGSGWEGRKVHGTIAIRTGYAHFPREPKRSRRKERPRYAWHGN